MISTTKKEKELHLKRMAELEKVAAAFANTSHTFALLVVEVHTIAES